MQRRRKTTANLVIQGNVVSRFSSRIPLNNYEDSETGLFVRKSAKA